MRLIIYRRWQKIIEGLAENRNERLNYFCICYDARTAVALADAGMGTAIIPESVKRMFHSTDIAFKEICDPVIHSDICAVSKKNGYMSLAMKLFYDSITK